MAELGATSILTNEFKTKIDQKKGLANVVGSGLGSGVGEVSVEIDVNKDHSAITLATMLAPSPDCYVAVKY